MELWNGFKMEKEIFDGKELISVFPEKPNGKWMLKTEYFGAFPDAEIELLKLGYHLFHIQNTTRWHVDEDTERRAKLAEYVSVKYGLSKKCVVVGMSCGGMQGIYFGAKYPQYVSCMYLDAPVVNLLSCPAGLGEATDSLFEDFKKHRGMDISELLSYRNHPLDKIPDLIKHNIPIILIAGDSDSVVPYNENGKLLNDAYVQNGCTIETIVKKGCDHHPHGLVDNAPLVDFITKYDL